jgi:MFS transporter, DHA2 family, multidrug resistance protein
VAETLLDQDGLPHINPWLIATAVMLATFMEVLDTTVVNVSLPHIAGDLSATADEATWALTSYLVANAIVLPITGWLSRRFGRKNLLMASVVGFTVSSFLCGLAPTLGTLVLFRILQGASGGCLQPLSQAVLLEAFPPEERGRAMGFWGLGIVVAPVLGPVLGGWLTDSYSWRWVFYINIPVGIASIWMTRAYIRDPGYLRQRERVGVDYWGIGMLAVWVGALQMLLDKGQQEDWLSSSFIRWCAVIMIASFIAFLVREFTADHPVVDLRVFKQRTYATGAFLMTVVGFGLYGSLVLLPLWLQTLLGYPALQAGFAMAPRGIGSMIAMPLVGLTMRKFDPRRFLAAGVLLCAFTLFRFSRLNLESGYWDFFWPQIIQGMSLGLLFVPLTTITMSPISKEGMGNATSLFNLTRNIGGSVGIAMVTTLNARYQQAYVNRLGEHFTPYNPAATNMLHGLQSMFLGLGSGPVRAGRQAVAMAFGMVQRQAAMLAFVDVFLLLAAMFLALVPLIAIMKRPDHGPGPSEEVSLH